MTDRRLPAGMTPRLLSRDAAAAYCGLSPNAFEDHVAAAVPPIRIGQRKLWDIRSLDRWLDELAGFEAPTGQPDDEETLLGRIHARKAALRHTPS